MFLTLVVLFLLTFVQNSDSDSDSEAFTRPSSVGLPNEAPPEESGPAQGHVRTNQPSVCLPNTGEVAASANQKGNATGRCNSVEAGCGLDKEDAKPSLVTSSALISYSTDKEAVQEEVLGQIPSGWKVGFAI
jgi:hypothetical protein